MALRAQATFAPKSHNLEALKSNVPMLQTLGIDTWLLAGEELLQLAPYLAADDISWVAYEPGPGFADPHLTRTGFAQAARRNGAHVLQGFPPSESR